MSKNTVSLMNNDGLILSGYQKKLKTMKKKFFVLYKDTLHTQARLEYYDNERKFKAGLAPKRFIKLKDCFNINRRLDTKYDFVIALSTKDGGFGIVFESENEMLKWLEIFISLQRCDSNISESLRPHFEHVWQVQVQRKGLADDKGIVGNYHVCLTPKSVTFIRIGLEKTPSGDPRISNIEFLLTTIRRCGDSHCFFYMEVGRQSIIGPGELWMETEDALIAQNMHSMILSAMSAKGDVNIEPMRKRSSSANEASKPINVLQRRQNQQENKNYNSPQTIVYFGRERCDSLPSRNRSLSECSNQSFTSPSVLTNRNTSVSGLRPHSYQRHSNSPPMSSTIGCSESEESSISMDEPDDNGSFISYRFNSRSSEGVIPEENTEELVSSDNKSNEYNEQIDKQSYSLPIPDYTGESYVSMAPVKPSKDLVVLNKLNQFMHISSKDDFNCVAYTSPVNHNSSISGIEFNEYPSEKESKALMNDPEAVLERPTRAYSIGSKVEHNKINKRLGNCNEADQNTIRVRAFSVGARAKIPRCDLQRGVLFPKSMIEHNFNSNNNICSISDVTTFNHLLNIKVCRDKKSTSAPLLIHKSHSSVDRMGDLMEIDFSKSSNNTTNRIHSSSKAQFSRSIPSTARDQSNKCDLTIIPVSHKADMFENNPLSAKLEAETDNGYLEMKPVGNILCKKSPTLLSQNKERLNCNFNEFTANKSIMEKSEVPDNKILQHKNINSVELAQKTKESDKNDEYQGDLSLQDDLVPQSHNEGEIKDASPYDANAIKKCFYNNLIANTIVSNVNNSLTYNLTSKYSELTLSLTPETENKSVNKDDYINFDVKYNENMSTNLKNCSKLKTSCNKDEVLAHSISHEDYKNESKSAEKKLIQCNESGYEILQIKSDSSLQSHKPVNRPTVRKEKHQQCQHIQSRPKSTNSSAAITSSSSCSSTLCGCPSSSNSYLNNMPASNTPAIIAKDLNNTSVLNTQIHASRPPSVGSEHELYYASLDLPACNTEVSLKSNKQEYLGNCSPVSNINNSYAKIDFDLSDSSSSSSKHVNI